MVFKVPIIICNKIDQICCKFLWAKGENDKNLSLVAWNEVCSNKMKGGLRLRKMKQVSLALRGKLLWQQATGI